jgi:hypothetical protein
MVLTEMATGNKVQAIIEPVKPGDYKIIKKSKRFPVFDWDKEKRNEVLKIRLIDSGEILGLMSLIDFKTEMWIKINLLQSSEDNVGKYKKYEGIAGCLIAYACNLAFEKGYGGTVSLEPKTVLMEHYIKKYDLNNGGKHFYTELQNSKLLIEKYLL